MPDQKLENLLNLAMNALPHEREKSENLNVGYDPTTRLWDVIVKYSGPESGLGGERIQVVPLLGSYAVVTLPETEISAYSVREQIEFIEKPKRLYFETFEEREASCILPVQNGADGLTGKGILVGIVDSGVDYFHPDFRNEDGSTRILRLWDQSVAGNPPENYVSGTEYTKEEIDEALTLGETEGRRLVPSGDFSGHGTAVLGIAAGNGRASEGVNRMQIFIGQQSLCQRRKCNKAGALFSGQRQYLLLHSTIKHTITILADQTRHTGTSQYFISHLCLHRRIL